jgi:hypothetical protein
VDVTGGVAVACALDGARPMVGACACITVGDVTTGVLVDAARGRVDNSSVTGAALGDKMTTGLFVRASPWIEL